MNIVVARRKRKKGWWIFPLLAVALVYTAFTVYSQSRDMYAIRIEIKEVQSASTGRRPQAELLKQKDELSSDESIEKLAWEKLGMVKDGERIFVDTNQ